jgi:hypothetical protein
MGSVSQVYFCISSVIEICSVFRTDWIKDGFVFALARARNQWLGGCLFWKPNKMEFSTGENFSSAIFRLGCALAATGGEAGLAGKNGDRKL